MIYGRQSVSQAAGQSASRPTSQPARLLVGQALLVPFHASRQSMQELSSLGRSSIRVLRIRFQLLFAGTGGRSSGERGKIRRDGGEKVQRSRGRGGGRDKLLDRELVACSSKKNWKSVALLTGRRIPERREERTEGETVQGEGVP